MCFKVVLMALPSAANVCCINVTRAVFTLVVLFLFKLRRENFTVSPCISIHYV
jgi:hypothetical protein